MITIITIIIIITMMFGHVVVKAVPESC